MKKLMIALGAVAIAAGVQAATFQWQNSSGIAKANTVTEDVPGGVAFTSGNVYLIDAGKYSQQALFTALAATPNWDMSTVTSLASANAYNSGTFTASMKFGSVSKGTLNTTSKIVSWDPTSDGYAVDNSYSFYQVIVDGDNFYITESVTSKLSDTGNTALKFGNSEARTYNTPAELPATFAHGGWYTAAAVPEPTSGLLLLLGVAGLALRRRRA